MLFNSYEFIFGLLPIAWLVYRLALRAGKHEAGLTAVLIASIFFYGWWNPNYVVLILASMGFNFSVGLGLENPRIAPGRRRLLLAIGVTANLLLLGYFKYAAFAVTNVNWIAGSDFTVPNIVLPLAISFFTFQQIAYLVDAFRGETREYSFLHYALFVTFFPQLIAGPIVHHKEIMPEFQRVRTEGVSSNEVATGACFFVIGLFKKVVIADNVAVYASPVFAAADAGGELAPAIAWIGVLAYTLQLYFDFSGYADMAVGAARMFGIRLPYNFNSPYKALNISEFWRRWHMTLSRFLRDYLYIPLGGNRLGGFRQHVNLLVTMLLGGLWHGAGWNFVIWGGLHGAALVVNHWWRSLRPDAGRAGGSRAGSALVQASSWALTMLVVIAGWALFRATTFDGAMNMLAGMAGMGGESIAAPLAHADLQNAILLMVTGFAIALFMPNSQQLLDGIPLARRMSLPSIPYRLTLTGRTATAFGVLLFACLANMSEVSEFLYFQF